MWSITDLTAEKTSRKGFFARVGAAIVAAAAGGSVIASEADAHHFCGHIYTTGSCPHPTGLPRVDARGFPLRARDGVPIDDLGRRIGRGGRPIDGQGRPLRDASGRLLAPAPRTRLCQDNISRRIGKRTFQDGSWYRCCGGRVRKLVDCCAYHNTRINGDRALTGYCSKGRKVYCVMYYDTKIPC